MTETVKTGLEMLAEVEATLRARGKNYGPTADNFTRIADRWDQYTRKARSESRYLSATQVAYMMIDAKLSRLIATEDHYDSLLDIIGYAVCAQDCIKAEHDRHQKFLDDIRATRAEPGREEIDFDQLWQEDETVVRLFNGEKEPYNE